MQPKNSIVLAAATMLLRTVTATPTREFSTTEINTVDVESLDDFNTTDVDTVSAEWFDMGGSMPIREITKLIEHCWCGFNCAIKVAADMGIKSLAAACDRPNIIRVYEPVEQCVRNECPWQMECTKQLPCDYCSPWSHQTCSPKYISPIGKHDKKYGPRYGMGKGKALAAETDSDLDSNMKDANLDEDADVGLDMDTDLDVNANIDSD